MVSSTTKLRGSGREVMIGADRPAVMIGAQASVYDAKDCASPSGKRDFAAICQEAVNQAKAGADVIEIRATGMGGDEASCLPALVEMVAHVVLAPLCIGAEDPKALDAALAVCAGKPIAYLINQQSGAWQDFLGVAHRRGAAVIVQAVESDGAPAPYDARVETARRILRECISKGIARDDVIVDPVASPVAGNEAAASTALKVAARVAQLDCINQTLRISSALAGLPDGEMFGAQFIARALAAGITCPIVTATADRRSVLLADLLMGRPGALRMYLDFAGAGR
jgi:5-methyltetrahydrofolate--homocysteine methyltransferase